MARKKSETKNFWLMKTEPEVFSFEDLLQAPDQTTCWEGVRNYQARNFMRDGMALGDLVFIYHSNGSPPGIAGVARVVREAYPDPTQWEKKSPYYDEGSRRDGEPRWLMVDVQAVEPLPRLLTLPELRERKDLEGMVLLQKGSRLSVQPVKPSEWQVICRMAGLKIG